VAWQGASRRRPTRTSSSCSRGYQRLPIGIPEGICVESVCQVAFGHQVLLENGIEDDECQCGLATGDHESPLVRP
jgi:hypothetical protein